MRSGYKTPRHSRKFMIVAARRGFALVAVIVIMVLITLLAIGLLGLSTISTRTSDRNVAMAEARANARLALNIAIGELQKHMGPDQRISANGAILSESQIANHQWTGVWDSWKAGEGESSQHSTIGTSDQMAPDYGDNRQDNFRSWLVSLPVSQRSEVLSAAAVNLNASYNPDRSQDAVVLVGEGSLGSDLDPADIVGAPLVDVDSSSQELGGGRYGWWVGDESQKAKIMADVYESGGSLSQAERIYRSQAPGSMGNKRIAGLEGLTDESQLGKVATMKTLDLINLDEGPASSSTVSQQNFHDISPFSYGVMSDVREGGLKRDLSTLLARQINRNEDGDEFMLYRFDGPTEDRVPIQDLSAYYQLYNQNAPWEGSGQLGGIEHSGGAISTTYPDFNTRGTTGYLRQYTSLYRSPVPVKVQFVIAAGASFITQDERDYANAYLTSRNKPPLRATDTHKLSMGIMPVVSLWNPNNIPLEIDTNARFQMKVNCPPFAIQWRKYSASGSDYNSVYTNLNYAIGIESTHGDARARSLDPFLIKLRFARTQPITFEPGEVRMFSIPIDNANRLESDGEVLIGNRNLYDAVEYFPDGFYVTAKTAPPRDNEVVKFDEGGNYAGFKMVFNPSDKISIAAVAEQYGSRARSPSTANEVIGGAFNFWLADDNYVGSYDNYRNYQFISRFGGSGAPNNPIINFNRELMLPGFPNGEEIDFDAETDAIPGSTIISATNNGEAKGMLLFSMMAGCESHLSSNGGVGAGRRITSRPFLHGSTLAAPQIVDYSSSALYDYGWEWQVDKINEVEEAFQDDGNSRGYYGGGYTIESGTTQVVQQYLPVVPPISIASLSSAQLGGYSLARNAVVGDNPDQAMNRYQFPPGRTTWPFGGAPLLGDFRQATATGQGGMLPQTLQAIGNSYAHPNIPANQAFKSYTQFLNEDLSATDQRRTYADHSYLVNKALWDEFFFSSITPQLSSIPLYGGNLSAVDVAENFLFENESLPNHRFISYTLELNDETFDDLKTQYEDYEDGFADKIASHMLVSGPFNINSTSVQAWKAFFSSLKGKPVSYFEDNASSISTNTPDGVTSEPGVLPNGEPLPTSELNSDPNSPAEQWASSRMLSDVEIDELAEAMVEQVKKRGPFLSLSEFINRRLDSGDKELSLKGALQAAIDDPDVSINEAFRSSTRLLDGEPSLPNSVEFSEALQGPAAYGSTPYVDQADILRHFAAQMAPRGDTFVIRAYGDSLDASGNVEARAWCEAVVQRFPDYVDPADESYLKQSLLQSSSNISFGRQFVMIGFRWLNADEI